MSKGIHNEEDLKKKLRWTHAETFNTSARATPKKWDGRTLRVRAAWHARGGLARATSRPWACPAFF